MNMASSPPTSADKLAKLRSLADIHEQLAIELRQEVAILSGSGEPGADPVASKDIARRLLAFRRRLRGQYLQDLGDSFLQDPALDLILEAFIQQVEQRPVSITGLHNGAESSQTTALRWGAKLCEVGIGIRSEDARDHRREWFALSPEFYNQLVVMLALIGANSSP